MLKCNEKHFSNIFGNSEQRVNKVGNIVYCHIPYLPEVLNLYKESESDLIFVCEGGDMCLHLSNDKTMVATGNTSQVFKQFPISEINPRIKKIYSTNLNFHHPLFELLPGGGCSNMDDTILKLKSVGVNSKDILILANFSLHTRGAAGRERNDILNYIKANNKITYHHHGGGDGRMAEMTLEGLLSGIYRSKYVICPISNGYNTSRLWECWELNAIPVVKRCPFFEIHQRIGYPIVIIDDWRELNELFLEKLDKTYTYYNDQLLNNRNIFSEIFWIDKINEQFLH